MKFKAPYDARNEADYKSMTKSIDSALKLIGENSSINATEKSLCCLAGCSRGTLRNRAYPLKKLKEIKARRSTNKEKASALGALEQNFVEESDAESLKSLRREIHLCNTENAILLNKYFAKEAECKEALRLVTLLQKSKQVAEHKIRQMEKLLAEAGILSIAAEDDIS
ncbi:MAG: hypothetical protein M3384_18630 [Acidobacteriota bacterium]|nr:hypothetical protein [Acidobacteriota bacterium]